MMVEPYDDPAIIAGQGTCGLEIVEDLPEVTSVLVPVSGGGLSSGVATAVKALAPSARVIGVEPELAADAKESLERGELVYWTAEQTVRTMADGLRTNSLGPLPFEHLRRFMDEIVTVSEDELADAMRQLAHQGRLVVEPSGAAAMAAHLGGHAPRVSGDDARVVIISGGNSIPSSSSASSPASSSARAPRHGPAADRRRWSDPRATPPPHPAGCHPAPPNCGRA